MRGLHNERPAECPRGVIMHCTFSVCQICTREMLAVMAKCWKCTNWVEGASTISGEVQVFIFQSPKHPRIERVIKSVYCKCDYLTWASVSKKTNVFIRRALQFRVRQLTCRPSIKKGVTCDQDVNIVNNFKTYNNKLSKFLVTTRVFCGDSVQALHT